MAVVLVVFVGWTMASFAEEASSPVSSSQTTPETREEILKINDLVKIKKQQIDELSKAISAQKQRIAQKRKEAATIETQIGILNNRIAKTELDIQETQAEIEVAELEIKGLDLAIEEKRLAIDLQKGYVAEYLRTMYRYQDRSYLEVLLLNDSFSEFFDYIKYLEDVEKNLAGHLTELRTLKASLEGQREAKEQKKTTLDELTTKLTEARDRLVEERSSKETLADAALLTETQLRSELSRMRAEQAAADTEILSLENSLRRKLAESDRFARLGDSVVLSWPVDPSRGITTYFHDPDYPFRYVFEHPGLDIRAGQGTYVRASGPGFVARARDAGLGYSYVMIIHADGISTVYGHLSRIMVGQDQFVERGDVIALSGGMPGTSGAGRLTTGPHLHFEVRSNGIPVNPLEYLLR